MKRKFALTNVIVALAAIMCGCSSVNWETVQYMTPANEINLKKASSVKLVARDNRPSTAELVAQLGATFAKTKQFKLDDTNPDYWIVVSGEKMFRGDDKAAALFNRNVEKLRQENVQGGHDYIKETDYQSSAAAYGASVAVYSVKELAPVYYFDVVMYDSDFSNGKIRSEKEFYGMFARSIVNKFNDSFLTQKRGIETALPKNADPSLVNGLKSGDAERVFNAARHHIPEPFEKFMKDVYAGAYKDKEDVIETKLSDYYILALAQEMGSFDIKLLKKLHAQHVAILNLTESSGLTTACPNSIARIETKLKLLQALK